jgi:hypothetical protein
MGDFTRILLGFMGAGLWMVLRTETLMEWFGEVEWAEDKLGPGQSRLFYKLVGTGASFFGIAIVTNLIDEILRGFAGIFVR